MPEFENVSKRWFEGLVGHVLFAVCISRNLMLKVSILGVLCYHWLGRVAADPKIIGLEVN